MIQTGNKVTLNYTGKFEDGRIFDTSIGKKPLVFVVGNKELIPGFEISVLGKNSGDKVSIVVSPEDGYGESKPELIFKVPVSKLPVEPKVGNKVQVNIGPQKISAEIVEIADGEAYLDANHPLAGKILLFEIDILEVQ